VGLDFFYTVTTTGDPVITYGATLPTVHAQRRDHQRNFHRSLNVMIPLTATNGTGSDQQTPVVTVAANTEGVSGTWAGKFKGNSSTKPEAARPAPPTAAQSKSPSSSRAAS
jgi:hypothetical protein